MKFKHLLILLFIFKSGGICFCQETPGNLYLIDKLIDESLLTLENKLVILGNDKFYEIEIDLTTPEAIYFLYKIRQKFVNYKFTVNEKFDSTYFVLKLKDISIKPFYSDSQSNDLEGNKLTDREIRIKYEYEIIDLTTDKILYKDKIFKKAKDTFYTDQKDKLEDVRYTFTQGNLPAENNVNSYLYPSIIVAVSAAAIILFFTIRSN